MATNWDTLSGYGMAGGLPGMGLSSLGGETKDFLFGTGFKKVPTMTSEQKSLLSTILQSLGGQGQLGQGYGHALGGLQDFLDPSSEAMQRFTDPYMREFEQQTVPGLAERFAGAGAMGGGLSSSGFGQALSAAGGNLQSQLASLKTLLQRQAINDLMSQYQGMAGMGLGAQPFGYQSPQQGFIPQMIGMFAQGLGKGATGGM